MNITQRQLTVCLLVVLAGPAAALRGEEETYAGDSLPEQPPVISGPALAPVFTRRGEGARRQCRCGDGEVSGADPCRRRTGRPIRSAHAADPSATGLPAAVGLPFGASSRALFGAQVANGRAAQMVLYQYDFLPGKAALAPAGRRKLMELFPLLVQTPFPLIVEPAGSAPGLDEARRRSVVQHLAGLPYPVPAERVIVAPPPSPGMTGVEAESLHFKFLGTMIGGGAAGGGPASPLPYPPQ